MFVETKFDNFVRRLQEHEIKTSTKYVLVKSPKIFNIEQVSPTSKQQIYWQDDTPYFHFGSKRYLCHRGKDANLCKKKKYGEERDKKAAMEHSFIKRYNRTQVTKKLGCPATVTVSRVVRVPEYKINGSGSGSRSYAKKKAAKTIRKKIESDERVGEEAYIFNLPDISEHSCHLIGKSAAVIEPVDSRVREYVTQLVIIGERNALVISKLLNGYVQNELQEHDKLRRRFFPNMATIRSMISSAKSKLAKSPIDKENADTLIESWVSDPSSSMEPAQAMPQYQELPLRGSTKSHLVNDCNSEIRSLQSILWYLGDSDLEVLKKTLIDLHKTTSAKVCTDQNTRLPVEPQTDLVKKSSVDKKRADYKKLPLRPKKVPKPRVGMVANMLKESGCTIINQIGGMVQCTFCPFYENSESVSENKQMTCSFCSKSNLF